MKNKRYQLTLKLVGAFSRRTLMFLPAVDEMTFKDGFGKPPFFINDRTA